MAVIHPCRHAMSMAKRAQLASLMLLGCVSLAWAADKVVDQVAQLGDDFLEYLGSLEGDDESWMDFSNDAVTSRGLLKDSAKQDTKVTASASSSSAASVTTNTASKATGKADK